MKLQKKELVLIFKILQANVNTDSVKFNYWVSKNLKLINSEIEVIKSIEDQNMEVISEYKKDQRILIEKYGEIVDASIGKYMIPEKNIGAFSDESEIIEKKHEANITLFTEKEQALNSILSEEVEYEFFKISYDILPTKNLQNIEESINSMVILTKYEIID